MHHALHVLDTPANYHLVQIVYPFLAVFCTTNTSEIYGQTLSTMCQMEDTTLLPCTLHMNMSFPSTSATYKMTRGISILPSWRIILPKDLLWLHTCFTANDMTRITCMIYKTIYLHLAKYWCTAISLQHRTSINSGCHSYKMSFSNTSELMLSQHTSSLYKQTA